MKIFQIHNEYRYFGGEDSVVNEEANLLRYFKHDVTQIIRDNKIELNSVIKQFSALKNLSYSNISINILKKEILKKGRPDIVHVHNTFPLWSYSIFEFLKNEKIPIIFTLHNYRLIWNKFGIFDRRLKNYGYFKNSKFKTFLISRILNKNARYLNLVDKFITFTEFTKSELLRSGLPEEKFVIKPNFLINKPFNIQDFNRKNEAIFASRISDEKGIKTLVKAWKNINTRINIFGDGPLLDNLKKANKTNESLIFHGPRDRSFIENMIPKAKFMVFPSEWYECMPMTILESFRAGTLVIASNIGSIKHIIKDEFNGILFKPGNSKDLTDKINWSLNNPNECNKITKNALNDFNKKYDDKTNYQQLIKIYKECINNYKK
jgi:glycosyltransferase involved in cell wall biosynthesis